MSTFTRHSSRQRETKNGLSAVGLTSYTTRPRNRHRYCGKEKDSESGLYYYGARYYESWTCRFVSVDPLAEKYAQLSSYNYADNSPVTDLDVDGLQSTGSSTSEQGGEPTYSGKAIDKSDKNNWKIIDVHGQTEKQMLASNLTPTIDEIEVTPTRNYDQISDIFHSQLKLLGPNGIENKQLREEYKSRSAQLQSLPGATEAEVASNKKSRSLLRDEIRTRTSQPMRAVLDYLAPMSLKKEQDDNRIKNGTGDASKTNKKFDQIARRVGRVGKAMTGVAVVWSIYNISQSDNKAMAVVEESASWAGAIAMGSEFAELGALIGSSFGPVGTIVGGAAGLLIGGALGGYLGRKVINNMSNANRR